jgi:ABC-type nitrate/sulfonate/bicarbonate transport system ATPase subunit
MVENAPEVIIRNLNRIYKGSDEYIYAVKDVSLTLSPGSFTALVGFSGCGKTTLLRLLAGLEAPTSGSISLFPEDTYPAVIFQSPRLLPWMTIQKNMNIALRHRSFPKGGRQEMKQRVLAALDIVGLKDRADAYPHELSGGMAQRVGLARALCQKSGFVLMDEPFSSLDALTRENLQKELKFIWEKKKSTTLFITHDLSEALTLASRILIMREGSIVADLDRKDRILQNDPEAAIMSLMDDQPLSRAVSLHS